MEPLAFDWIIKNKFPEADFWLINKGSADTLGKPVKEYQPFLTGLKVPVVILPDYGFYLCLYLYQQGFWKQYSHGATNLQNLRLREIRQVFKAMADDHRQQKQVILVR